MSSVLLNPVDRTTGPRARRVYIVGAGVAGLLTAWAIRQTGQTELPLVMVDRAAAPGSGLTAGNGRSLTATEGLVAGGLTPAQLAQAFETPVDQGGYAYPGFVAQGADRAAIGAFLERARAQEPTAADRERAMLQLGFRNLHLWRELAAQDPHLAARTGLQLGAKLRVYQGPQAETKANQEVARLHRAAGDRSVAALVSVAEALALNPGLAPFLGAAAFAGQITRQPGGAIHAGRLVAELTDRLNQMGRIQWQLNTEIAGIDRDASGQIQQLRAHQGGKAITLGRATDRFIFATGFDPLLEQSGAVSQPLFPIAGTSITFSIPRSAIAQGLTFPRRAWKQDGSAGPLVISPTLIPTTAFLDWLDQQRALDRLALDLSGDATDWIDHTWAAAWGDRLIPLDVLDPRRLDRFQPEALGAAAGDWEIRIGGCKFYPGVDRPLDLQHPGARWALRSQLRAAAQFFPELWALHGSPNLESESPDWASLAALQPWVGARPVHADGQSTVAPCGPNGFVITGTGSWGLASGPGNGQRAAGWLADLPAAIDS